jgi:hypothetical protein
MEGSQDKNGMKVEIQIRKTVLHWFSPWDHLLNHDDLELSLDGPSAYDK